MTRNVAWKLARAEFERLESLDRRIRRGNTGSHSPKLKATVRGLREIASQELARALEEACE